MCCSLIAVICINAETGATGSSFPAASTVESAFGHLEIGQFRTVFNRPRRKYHPKFRTVQSTTIKQHRTSYPGRLGAMADALSGCLSRSCPEVEALRLMWRARTTPGPRNTSVTCRRSGDRNPSLSPCEDVCPTRCMTRCEPKLASYLACMQVGTAVVGCCHPEYSLWVTATLDRSVYPRPR